MSHWNRRTNERAEVTGGSRPESDPDEAPPRHLFPTDTPHRGTVDPDHGVCNTREGVELRADGCVSGRSPVSSRRATCPVGGRRAGPAAGEGEKRQAYDSKERRTREPEKRGLTTGSGGRPGGWDRIVYRRESPHSDTGVRGLLDPILPFPSPPFPPFKRKAGFFFFF